MAGIDLRLCVFASGKVPALIVTTTAGAKRWREQGVPASGAIRAQRRGGHAIRLRAILDEVRRVSRGKRILIEGGPRLPGDYYAEQLVDEVLLTLAPGRDAGDRRLSLVMGKAFAPGDPLWGDLDRRAAR